MIIAIIDVTYLDTWVWRVQEGEDEVEDGGEDAGDPAELPTVTIISSISLPLNCSRPSVFSISGK